MKGEEKSFCRYLNVSGWNTLLDSCFIARVLTIFSFIQPWKPNESNDLGVHFSGCLSFLPSFLWAFIFSAVFYTPSVFSLLFPPSSVVPTFNSLHPPSSASVSLPLRGVFHRAGARHPKYNYSPQLNGEEWSLGITRNRKWSERLDWGGNGKSLIQLAEPRQQAPSGCYSGISGIKQCCSNHKRNCHPHQ